jgi:hypothetical protein
LKINQQLPAKAQSRFDELVAKRRDEALTAEEHVELLRLIEPAEAGDATRVGALIELARLRELSVDQLMDQLGIKPPANV